MYKWKETPQQETEVFRLSNKFELLLLLHCVWKSDKQSEALKRDNMRAQETVGNSTKCGVRGGKENSVERERGKMREKGGEGGGKDGGKGGGIGGKKREGKEGRKEGRKGGRERSRHC